MTPDRVKSDLEWTIPYFYVHRGMVYHKDHPIRSIEEINKLDGVVLGTFGSTGWLDIEKRLAKIGKMQFLQKGGSDEQDIEALRQGKVHGLMRGSFVAHAIAKRNPTIFRETKPWMALPGVVTSDGEVFAFPCAVGSGLAVLLTAYIAKSWMNGSLKNLSNKYHLSEEDL